MEELTNQEVVQKNSGNMKIVSIVIVIALIGAIAWYAMSGKSEVKTDIAAMKATTNETAITASTNTTAEASAPAGMKSLKNGTYEAEGDYQSPAGAEAIDVSMTIENGIVKSAEVTPKATAPKSKHFQGKFVDGFKELVVGKAVDQLSLTVVNGSSLTPKGFMDALKKIEVKAQA